ncbi:hypothetical protein GCM10010324_36390 [Streptomyces hiroshimensis]|uniref:Uncharacterized protein n=1 Tax=Streptomyces hiroshimensis TaxID=66424 RepID=A0ABQ2YKM2_9ACTN|nr:hypothetical protein GCM10010324_36390 [Streptomyces hiroshimensis]
MRDGARPRAGARGTGGTGLKILKRRASGFHLIEGKYDLPIYLVGAPELA